MKKPTHYKKLTEELNRESLYATDPKARAFKYSLDDKYDEMRRGYVNDPELSKLLMVMNMPDTILAERLDCAYSIYIRCEELMREKTYTNPIDNEFLKNMKSTYLEYVNNVLGGGKSEQDIQELMEERMHVRMKNYEFIPGKATNLAVRVPSTKKSVSEVRQLVDDALRDSLTDLIEQYNNSKDEPPLERARILSAIVYKTDAVMKQLEDKIKKKQITDKEIKQFELLDDLCTDSYSELSRLMGNPFGDEVTEFVSLCNAKSTDVESYNLIGNWAALKTANILNIIPKETSDRLNDLVNAGLILDVNLTSRIKDAQVDATYYDTKQRDDFRLVISNGKFTTEVRDLHNIPRLETYNTTYMQSHAGKGYCAYTLNLNGEISGFTHMHGKRDKGSLKLHSSMNAGNVVLCAGELKIENGKLLEITDHSGHYQPTVNQIYEAMKHFQDRGIDISETKVILINKIESVAHTTKRSKLGQKEFVYKANDFLDYAKSLDRETSKDQPKIEDPNLNNAVNSAKESLQQYISKTSKDTKDPWFKLLRFKDSVIKNITDNPIYIGKTEAKHRVAKLMLNDLNSLHGKDRDSIGDSMTKIADGFSSRTSIINSPTDNTLSKICKSMKDEAMTIHFEPSKTTPEPSTPRGSSIRSSR